jgi:RNA polymerase sigma-70 factor, ECF subfamily
LRGARAASTLDNAVIKGFQLCHGVERMQDRPSIVVGRSSFDSSLEAAKAGSNAALGRVLESCRTYLLVIAGREVRADLRPKVAPSDLVQETCIEAQRHFQRFSGTTKEELTAWLRGILHHRLQKAHRKFCAAAKRDLTRELPLDGFSSIVGPMVKIEADATSPGSKMMAEEDAQILAAALTRLTADYQQVICLRNWELRSFAEIGRIMCRSTRAVRSLWSRAVQRLARELETCNEPWPPPEG